MRFSTLIASTLVIYIATVSALPEHSFTSLSSVAHGQSTHLMAREKKNTPLLGGLVSGLLPGGKKKSAQIAKKAKKVKKSRKLKKAEAPQPNSPLPAAPRTADLANAAISAQALN